MEASNNTKISSFSLDLFSFQSVLHMIPRAMLSLISIYSTRLSCDSEFKFEQQRKDYDQGETQNVNPSEKVVEIDDCMLLGREINMVMERIGYKHQLEGEEIEKKWSFDELCEIFEEEPSLQEVREAFDVYDQNKDEFIDAWELQRVLCGLGLKQGLELESCRKMIELFDENCDGKIDFTEFVKFMTISL